MDRARSSLSASWSTPMTATSWCASAVITAAMPTPPRPTTIDGLAGLRPSGVDDGAATGEHGAAEQRRDHGWHVGGHRHHRAAVDDGVRGEAGHPEVVVDGLAVARQPPLAGHQGARGVGGAARFARCQSVGGARRAVAAPGQKGHDDALPDGHVRHGGAGLLDDRRRLVAEQHRHRAAPGCRRRPTGRNGTARRPRCGPGARCRRAGRGRVRRPTAAAIRRTAGVRPICSSTAPRILMTTSLP